MQGLLGIHLAIGHQGFWERMNRWEGRDSENLVQLIAQFDSQGFATTHQSDRRCSSFQVLSKLLYCPAESWVSIMRSDVACGLENKLSRCVSRVGHNQPSASTHQFTVKHNVQIDGAGIPAYFPFTPQLLFGLLQHLEDFSS